MRLSFAIATGVTCHAPFRRAAPRLVVAAGRSARGDRPGIFRPDHRIPRQEFHDYLQALVTAGLGDRLMFGSDQMVWPESITLAIEGVDSAAFLTPEQKRAIFHENAARFLRLEAGEGR